MDNGLGIWTVRSIFSLKPRGRQFGTILADPPWQVQNRTGKVAPEHKRLNRYGMMKLNDFVGPSQIPLAN